MRRERRVIRRSKKDPIKFSKKIVVSCIVFIVIYTLLHTYLDYVHSTEISPTLTTCVFTFFGTELASSALIKIFEREDNSLKSKEKKSEDIDESDG